MIKKIQTDKNNDYFKELYYDRARDAMFDVVNQLVFHGYSKIFLPGYIGWSPKEGSGIFDPLNKIKGLERDYYLMDRKLNIKFEDLKRRITPSSILLVINYFGFRDNNLKDIIEYAHQNKCVVIEDNAHAFYTYHLSKPYKSDISFFSLHKMLPFSSGGSLIVKDKFNYLNLNGRVTANENPYSYHIYSIAVKRKENFTILNKLTMDYKKYFIPLRTLDDIQQNIPQTYPIILLKGDRNKIYNLMNDQGFGVVSLYHTMIDELKNDKFEDSDWVSQRILNLPLHQDVNKYEYENMIECLINCIKETE